MRLLPAVSEPFTPHTEELIVDTRKHSVAADATRLRGVDGAWKKGNRQPPVLEYRVLPLLAITPRLTTLSHIPLRRHRETWDACACFISEEKQLHGQGRKVGARIRFFSPEDSIVTEF